MKKQLFVIVLALALVLSFSCGALAHTNINTTGGDNQYKLTEAVSDGTTIAADGLYIATVKAYKAANPGETTYFQNGEALDDDDIIISNGKVACVLAVGTRNPWGYPAGSILDAGYLKDGVPQRDTVWAIEFLAHRWDSWAPANCGEVTFDIVKYDFANKVEDSVNGQIAVKVSRVWISDTKDQDVLIESYYGIDANAEYIKYYTEVTNNGSASAFMKNDYAITNKGDDGAFMNNLDSVYATGNYGNTEGQEFSTFIFLSDTEKSSKATYFKGSLGYKELVSETTLAAGESRTLGCYIAIDDEPTTEAVNALMNASATTYKVSGVVKDAAANIVENPVVVIKDASDKTVGWVIGNEDGEYEAQLPAGEYKLFVERDGFGAGATESVTVEAAAVVQDLTSGAAKKTIKFNLKDQDGNPLYGKVVIKDAYPTVRFCGDSVFQAAEAGVVEAEIAEGEYTAYVFGEGFWFYSDATTIEGKTVDGDVDVTITKEFEEPTGWLSADMHHHGNKNDGFAFPEEVIQSILASDLDVAFITDHDFTVNNYEGYTLAKEYGLTAFLPSEEITCSWAHFNVLPLDEEAYEYFLDEDQENHVMDQFSKLPEFVAETHAHNASITANHPWYSYGLFNAASGGSVPGGYTDDFDCIEINSCNSAAEDANTILSLEKNWTAYLTGESAEGFVDADGEEVVVEKAHYVVGGSDTHDVIHPGFVASNLKSNPSDRTSTQYQTGKIRTFGFVGIDTVEGDVEANGLQFTNAVNEGHSYVSYGPVLDMNYIPGYTYEDIDGEFEWEITVNSLESISKVYALTDKGDDTVSFEGGSILVDYDVDVDCYRYDSCQTDITVTVETTDELGYVAVLIVDSNGNYALTNPCWIKSCEISDVNPEDWFVESLEVLKNYGAVQGYPDGTFRPENNVTRAEFAQILYKFISNEKVAAMLSDYYDFTYEATKDMKFSDVKDTAWYAEAVYGLANAGIINGYPDGTFKPDQNISRAEIASLISNVVGDIPSYRKLLFTDAQGKWYQKAVDNLSQGGLISGYIDGTFKGDNLAKRSEACQFITNMLYLKGFVYYDNIIAY